MHLLYIRLKNGRNLMLRIEGLQGAVIGSERFYINVLCIIIEQGGQCFTVRPIVPDRQGEREAKLFLRPNTLKGLYRRKTDQPVEDIPQGALLQQVFPENCGELLRRQKRR